jgi:hypothetical protein
MALVVAIGFLLVLSLLGAAVLTVANRGLHDEGSKHDTASFSRNRNLFYTVDRAVEYAMNGDFVYNLSMSGSIDLVTGEAKDRNGNDLLDPDGDPLTHKQIIELGSDDAGRPQLKSGLVTDLGPQSLPASLAGKFTTDFGANLYHVTAEAESLTGDIQKVDASIVRLYKLEDDVIFRTTGGG